MPVLGDASLYLNDYDPNEKWNVVIFSHGLGSNLNNYSSLCGWLASHGYIVVSIQHNHDHVRILFEPELVKEENHKALERLFYQGRNKDLHTRTR